MRKYIIDDKTYLIHSRLRRFFEKKYELEKRFRDSQMYVTWVHELGGVIQCDMYFEVRRELKGVFDYSILRRETAQVIDFISDNFEVAKEAISIYFNGSDGFYIIIASDFTGIYECSDPFMAIKETADCIIKETGIDSVRTDIYEINSYRLPLQGLNKATGLYTVGLTYDMLNQFTYKELVKYAENNEMISGVDLSKYRAGRLNSKLAEVVTQNKNIKIGELNLEDYADYSEWFKEYSNYDERINRDTVAEFYKLCSEDTKLQNIVDEGRAQYNKINMISNEVEECYREDILLEARFDFIKDFIQLLYLDDNGLDIFKLDNERRDRPNDVIARVTPEGAELIIYMDLYCIGNEDMCIISRKPNQKLSDKSFEEILDMVAMIYMHLKKHDEEKVLC